MHPMAKRWGGRQGKLEMNSQVEEIQGTGGGAWSYPQAPHEFSYPELSTPWVTGSSCSDYNHIDYGVSVSEACASGVLRALHSIDMVGNTAGHR